MHTLTILISTAAFPLPMIPPFTVSSVLPPFVGTSPVDRALNSPYRVAMTDVVSRFAINAERTAILRGLLDYRESLRAIGIVDGTQWLDGSFVEDCENTRQRPPDDLDVVTFASRPERDFARWRPVMAANLNLFDPRQAKAQFKCDAYFIDLLKRPDLIVSDTAYFFGLFSHQRATSLWKGMLEVPLNSDDAVARVML